MSRADQSLNKTIPKMCSSALSMVIGSPSALPAPMTKAISSSKSSRADGPNTGPLAPAGIVCPVGRLSSVPLATIDEALPW